MIERLVAFALRKRLVVVLVCIFIALYGYYSWTQLALEAYPDIADVTSQVITQALDWRPRRSSNKLPTLVGGVDGKVALLFGSFDEV